MSRERTSYVVAATFSLAGSDSPSRRRRLLVGRFHEKDAAVAHAARAKTALEGIDWVTDVVVGVETVWHLRSGSAVAQLARDIFEKSVLVATGESHQ